MSAQSLITRSNRSNARCLKADAFMRESTEQLRRLFAGQRAWRARDENLSCSRTTCIARDGIEDTSADLLRTSRRAIYAMIARRQLPGVVRIRRRVLVRSADLLDWLHQKRAPLPEE